MSAPDLILSWQEWDEKPENIQLVSALCDVVNREAAHLQVSPGELRNAITAERRKGSSLIRAILRQYAQV